MRLLPIALFVVAAAASVVQNSDPESELSKRKFWQSDPERIYKLFQAIMNANDGKLKHALCVNGGFSREQVPNEEEALRLMRLKDGKKHEAHQLDKYFVNRLFMTFEAKGWDPVFMICGMD